MVEIARAVGQFILEILFPSVCLNCRVYLARAEEKENSLCHHCFKGIEIYPVTFHPDPRFSLRAIASYENQALKNLLHYLKYENFFKLRRPLAKLINHYLEAFPITETKETAILPIPLHKRRLRQRGFNQAELISKILCQSLQLPLESSLLERYRETKPQIEMKNDRERKENVRNSIRIKEGKENALFQYQKVILVDDIYTSGATVQEAIKVIRGAGIKDITVFVIAKT